MDVPDETRTTTRDRLKSGEQRTHACSGWSVGRQDAIEIDKKCKARAAQEKRDKLDAENTEAIKHTLAAHGINPESTLADVFG